MSTATQTSSDPTALPIKDVAFVASVDVQKLTSDEAELRNKRTIMDALKAAGIDEAIVTYSGGGDSGKYEQATAHVAGQDAAWPAADVTLIDRECLDDAPAPDPEVNVPLQTAVRRLAQNIVVARHGDWWDGDGGAEGSVTFDVKTDKILLDHTSFYTESDRHEAEI